MSAENNIPKTRTQGSIPVEQGPLESPLRPASSGAGVAPSTGTPVNPEALKSLEGARRGARLGVSGVFENSAALRERDGKMNRLFEFGDELVGGALGQLIPNHSNPAVRARFPEYGRRP